MNVMNFSKQEIIEILRDDSKNKWLFSLADRVRRENVGDEVHLRSFPIFVKAPVNIAVYAVKTKI